MDRMIAEPLPADREREVVAQAKSGNYAAREALFLAHRRAVYLLALQLLGNPDDAMDVVQETLLRFFVTIGRFKEESPVRPWLMRIARNLSIDIIRKRSPRRIKPISEDEEMILDPPDPGPGPEALASRRQVQRRVWSAVCELKALHREILILRDYQDLSYREIAHVLEIPVGTVMSRLHKARSCLRELIEESPGKGKGNAEREEP